MLKKEIQKLLPQGALVFRGRLGDYSTNLAKQRYLDKDKLLDKLNKNKIFKKVLLENGFINFYLSQDYLRKIFKKIKAPKLGQDKIMVEFISANPTGPLHVGNGRGAFIGDCLSNVLAKVGHKITREYYINDAGQQVKDLAKGAYKGESRSFKEIQADNEAFIKEKLKINFDNYFSEKSLYPKETDKILALFKSKNLIYKKDHAVWFRSSELGDDKDRVLIKSNGYGTYILGDIAYHQNKFSKRKFAKSINLWGADHHGDVARLQAGIGVLGHKGKLDIILMQLVRLIKNGQEFKMSKRGGNYVTLEELVDEVGLDATRFFFLMYDSKTHMDFDLDLAKERSHKNPVYYVQYAHARIAGILEKAKKFNDEKLFKPEEFELINQLLKYPEVLEDIAQTYATHKLPHYAIELAKTFHNFYHKCRVLSGGKERLELVKKTKEILGEVLQLMGVVAPLKM